MVLWLCKRVSLFLGRFPGEASCHLQLSGSADKHRGRERESAHVAEYSFKLSSRLWAGVTRQECDRSRMRKCVECAQTCGRVPVALVSPSDPPYPLSFR